MKKVKRIICSRYLNKPMNVALLISCIVIVCTQLYFILHTWLKNSIEKIFFFINRNQLLLALIAGIIPLLPNLLLFIANKTKIIMKPKNSELEKISSEETEIFPGAITFEMIKDKKVVLISQRSLKTLQLNEKKPMILDRKNQCDVVIKYIHLLKKKATCKKLNCIFLTGTSGAGKTILLKWFLKNRLNSKQGEQTTSECLYFNQYDIACDLIYKSIISEKAKVIIMDQFENSIDYTEIYKYIKALIDKVNYPLIFIFSFPQSVFDQISLNLTNKVIKNEINSKRSVNFHSYTHFLGYDDHDIRQLKILINTFLKVGIKQVNECLSYSVQCFINTGSFLPVLNSGKYPSSLVFMCSILARIKTGKSPLVEFSIVSYIYELHRDEIDYNLEKYIDDLSKIFELYLDYWAEKFPNPDTGKMILQLISDGKKYTVDDLKCVTFEASESFLFSPKSVTKKEIPFNIKNALKQNKFITVQEEFFGFKFGVFAVHDFIALKMSEYCFEKLENELRQNVDYYKKKMVQTNQGYSMQVESKAKSKILKRYESFHTKQNQLFINILLYILMISSVLISYVNGCNFNNYKDNVYYIFIGIGCFFSTYYLYNVIMQFFRMLKKRYYYPLSICGTILIISCFAFPNFWGVFSGIEIVILGMSLYGARKDTVNLAIDFFREKGIFYMILGGVVICFGTEYAFINNSFMLKCTLAVFFIIYVIACNYSHIKYSYIMKLIGMGNTI